jgi:hypothetical protein
MEECSRMCNEENKRYTSRTVNVQKNNEVHVLIKI